MSAGDPPPHVAAVAAALVLGLALAATPFARHRWSAPHVDPAAHMDHAPRHGGVLAMVGDHHLEVRRDGARVFVWPSDARRRPLRSDAAWLLLDDGRTLPLVPAGGNADALGASPAPGPIVLWVLLDGELARLDVP